MEDRSDDRRGRDVEHRRLASVGVDADPVPDEQRAVEVVQPVDLLRDGVHPHALVAEDPVIGALVLLAVDVAPRRFAVHRRRLADDALDKVGVLGKRDEPLPKLADRPVLEDLLDEVEDVAAGPVPIQLIATDVPRVAGLLDVGVQVLAEVRPEFLIGQRASLRPARESREDLAQRHRHATPPCSARSLTRGRSSSHNA